MAQLKSFESFEALFDKKIQRLDYSFSGYQALQLRILPPKFHRQGRLQLSHEDPHRRSQRGFKFVKLSRMTRALNTIEHLNKKIICEGSTTSYIFNQGTGTVLYLPFELCPIIRLVAIFINIDLWE